jgi:transposase
MKEYIMGRFDLSDDEWGIIEPHFPKAGRGPARQDDRRILNGIFYILRTGAPWRDLPERYGLEQRFITATTDGANAVSGRTSLMHSPRSEKTA